VEGAAAAAAVITNEGVRIAVGVQVAAGELDLGGVELADRAPGARRPVLSWPRCSTASWRLSQKEVSSSEGPPGLPVQTTAFMASGVSQCAALPTILVRS